MRTLLTAGIVALTLMLGAGCGRRTSDSSQPTAASQSAPDLRWESSWDKAFKRARGDQRVVMVEFYADWCVWCKRMESTTFKDAKVVELLADRAVPVRLDAEREGRILAERFNVQGFPTVIFLDAKERELGRVPGFLDAADFAAKVRSWL